MEKLEFELGEARALIIELIEAYADKNEKEFKNIVEEDSKNILTTQGYEYSVALLNPKLQIVLMEK